MAAMRSLAAATLAAGLLLGACGTDGTPSDDDGDTDPPTTAFGDVQAILGQSCAFSTCHGSGSGYLQLRGTDADYDALVGVTAFAAPDETLVVPGDPDASYLMAKLDGAAGIVGDTMPQGGDLLDASTRDVIRDWIADGAPRD